MFVHSIFVLAVRANYVEFLNYERLAILINYSPNVNSDQFLLTYYNH